MKFTTLMAATGIVRNSDSSVTYRANKHVYLPKFGSDKTPFARSVPAQNPVAATPEAKVPAPMLAKAAPAPASATRAAVRQSGWTATLNPFSLLHNAKVVPPRVSRPEQTELSLDTIKVVSNDLRDSDVEVVPLKSRPPRPKNAIHEPPAWGGVGEDLLGANFV